MSPTFRRRAAPGAAQAVSCEPAPAGHNSLDALALKIEYVPTGSLIAPARELRRHPKRQIAQLEASMRQFGMIQPLVINRDSRIVCGVARLLAATNLKAARVPIVRVEHLSDLELRAFALADNKIGEGATWIPEVLGVELEELMLADFEIEVTGFNTVEIEQFVLSVPSGEPSETEEIEEPAAGPAVSREGDLFLIGEHKLLCGDARKRESYEALLGDDRARMIFGDFPYNVRIDRNVSGLGKVKHGEFVAASGEMTPEDFTTFKREIMEQLVAFSMPGSIHYICMDWRHQLEMMLAGNATYTELKNMLIWCKNNGGMSAFYRSQYELIYVWKSGKSPHINNFGLGEHGRYRTNVLNYPGCNTFRKGREEDLALHSTVKPTQLVADLIRDVSKLGEIVLDPCGGSGTTILAAERTKRKARCIELDPKYIDVAVRRCQDKLGLTGIHVETGLSFDDLGQLRLAAGEGSTQSGDA